MPPAVVRIVPWLITVIVVAVSYRIAKSEKVNLNVEFNGLKASVVAQG